jgi:hypothetical protein
MRFQGSCPSDESRSGPSFGGEAWPALTDALPKLLARGRVPQTAVIPTSRAATRRNLLPAGSIHAAGDIRFLRGFAASE